MATNRQPINIQALLQNLLHGEPISPAEIRELLIRHILTEKNNESSSGLTETLMDAYFKSRMQNHLHTDVINEKDLMNLAAGALPKCIPLGLGIYPADVIEQVLLSIKVMDGMDNP